MQSPSVRKIDCYLLFLLNILSYSLKYLNIVWYIQLCRRGWKQCRDVNAKQACYGHVHGAQFGWRDAKKEPNAGHLVALMESKSKSFSK